MAGLQTEPPHAVVASGLQTSTLTVGSTIFVDLPEHGISADFTVCEIRPCPTPSAGDGYLVTTKFIHENAEILDLRIAGSDEPIGTTSSHPFWSEDRQQFIAAGELRVGENLLLADDTTRRVELITLRPNRETVYNIEVDGEHVFYVGEDGVLVHNECRKIGGTWRIAQTIVDKNGVSRTVWRGIRNGQPQWTTAAREAAWRARGRLNGQGWQRRVRVRFRDGSIDEIIETKELHHLDPRHLGGSHNGSNLLEVWPEEHAALDSFRNIGYEVVEILSDPY